MLLDLECVLFSSVQMLTFQQIAFLSAVSPRVFMLMQLGLPERADGNETADTWSPFRRQAALLLFLPPRSCRNSPPRIILTSIHQTADFSCLTRRRTIPSPILPAAICHVPRFVHFRFQIRWQTCSHTHTQCHARTATTDTHRPCSTYRTFDDFEGVLSHGE